MKKMMKAAVLKEFGKPLSLEEIPVPEPGPGEALVKVVGSGLCATDLHIRDGRIPTVKPPYVPGHEMAGIIEKLGEGVTAHNVGEHVVVGIDVVCGECDLCKAGKSHLCRNRVRIGFERDGSHEEYCVVPEETLFPIRSDIPLDEACIIPDAVSCMYHAIKDQGQVKKGDKILIYGAGALGIQGVQAAKYLGAEVYVSGRTQAKLDVSKEFGADVTINTKQQDLHEKIMRLTEGLGCDVIFDLVGLTDSIDKLFRMLKPSGKLVEIGYTDMNFTVNYQETVVKEKEIIGVRGCTRENLIECIKLVEQGVLKPYIYKKYPLEKINEALEGLEKFQSVGRSVISYVLPEGD